jgi:hypothetical protein
LLIISDTYLYRVRENIKGKYVFLLVFGGLYSAISNFLYQKNYYSVDKFICSPAQGMDSLTLASLGDDKELQI